MPHHRKNFIKKLFEKFLVQDSDRYQNHIDCFLDHAVPLQKISSKCIRDFLSNLAYRQTDRDKNITSFIQLRPQQCVVIIAMMIVICRHSIRPATVQVNIEALAEVILAI